MVDASGTLHLLDKLKLADVRVENTSLMPGDYATRLSAGEIDDLVAYLSTRRERDLTIASTSTGTGGVTFDRLVERGRRAAELADVLGQLPGTHYSGAQADRPPRTSAAAGRLDVSDARTFRARSHAARRRRRDVHDAARRGGRARCADRAVRSGDTRGRRRSRIRTKSTRSTAASRSLGNRLFVGTLDAALVALDARTGLPLWETQVADTMLGYSLTSAPLVVKDKVLVGITGGEFGARGFLDAYDAATGKRLWRWYAVPGPGEFGNDTWKGDSWKLGGSPMWLTGSYDPELNTRLLDRRQSRAANRSIGARRSRQPVQRFGRRARSRHRPAQVALPVHAERRPRLGLCAGRHARRSRCGTARCASCCCTPIATASSTCSIAPTARFCRARRSSIRTGTPASTRTDGRMPIPGSNSSREGSFFVYPTVGGGTNFQAPSYSPVTGWLYLEYAENGQQYVSTPRSLRSGPAVHRPDDRSRRCGSSRSPASRRRRPASRRSIPKPERRCGTSRSSRAR